MIYVMLSRVQCLSQLFILEVLPEDKIKSFTEALEELKRMEELDISKPDEYDSSCLKIVSLNTRSLNAHIDDIKADHDLLASDAILFQEVWSNHQNQNEEYHLMGKSLQLNCKGRSRGIATYYSDNFDPLVNITEEAYQITSIKTRDLIIINIYRSNDCNDICLTDHLNELISSDNVSIVICGDFNICQREDSDHPVLSFLKRNNFIPGFNPPEPTHVSGRCLDQVYFKLMKNIKILKVIRSPCYFSDHCKVNITLKYC